MASRCIPAAQRARYIRHPIPLEGMSEPRRKEVAKRIARIHGHVHGIGEMLDEGRPYPEIVHQVSAVRSSLDAVIKIIVEDLVEESRSRMEKNQPIDPVILELGQVVANVR